MKQRERATSAHVQGGPGAPLPWPPARFWLVLGGIAAGVVAIAAGATVAGELILLVALAGGTLLEWIEERSRPANAERRCRVCGCTDERACVEIDLWGDFVACHWVEPDLCSSCQQSPFELDGECARCDGEGMVDRNLCPECLGSGAA